MSVGPDISYRAIHVWRRNFDVFIRLWKSEAWPPFIEALVTLVAFGFGLGSYITLGNQDYIHFLAPGILANAATLTAVFETTYGSHVRMEMQRIFDAIIATPVSIEDVVLGEILWAATRSLFAAFAILLTLFTLGLVESPWALAMLPVAFLGGIMFGSIGMLYTSVAPTINAYNYFFTLFVTPSLFFGAVFFPVDRLPEQLQAAVWFIPLSHLASSLRALNRGDIGFALAVDLVWMLSLTAIVMWFALGRMRARLVK